MTIHIVYSAYYNTYYVIHTMYTCVYTIYVDNNVDNLLIRILQPKTLYMYTYMLGPLDVYDCNTHIYLLSVYVLYTLTIERFLCYNTLPYMVIMFTYIISNKLYRL